MIIRDATSKAGGKAVSVAIGKCTVRKHLSSAITRDAHTAQKAKTNLRTHQKQVHLKIKAKSCHVCDRRFYSNQDLRAHMKSQHQTADHDMSKCDDCVIILQKNHRISQARIATLMRQVGKKSNTFDSYKQTGPRVPREESRRYSDVGRGKCTCFKRRASRTSANSQFE